jgi:hypothetical protein
MKDVALKCRCGTVEGAITDLAPGRYNRVVCYCDDCQAFARWLSRDGAPSITNDRGGTDIVQVWPSHVRFSRGVEKLQLVRLSSQGLLRWYTGCCNTPAGNMLPRPGSPFVGFSTAFAPSIDAVVGPPVGAIQGRFAKGGCPEGVHRTASAGVLAKSAWFLLRGLAAQKAKGSPFFADGRPIAAARVLTASERDALR